MKQVVATVISNSELVKGVSRHPRNVLSSRLIWLSCPDIDEEPKPGQFVMVRCGERCILPRPFSVHQVKGDSLALFFVVWEGGKGTEWLYQRTIGDMVELFGPLGNSFEVQPTSQNLLLIAAGIGIAPLYFLAQQQLNLGCSITLLYGTRTEHRYPEKLLPPGVEVVPATDNGKVGYHGMITDLLPDYVDLADQIFVCGPHAMYCDLAKKNPQLKNKPVQVSLEVRMGCGRGVCYGCTIKTKQGLKRVCQNGPVFDLDDILWDELDF